MLVTLDVAGLHRIQDPVAQRVVAVVVRGHDIQVALFHVAEQAAQVSGGQADLECPRHVGVAEDPGHVRQVFQQHTLVGHLLADRVRRAVDRDGHAAQQLQAQPGGSDDDVGWQFLARLEANAMLGEMLDLVRLHRRLAVANGLEQVAVGYCAQAFVPRHVVRGEVAHVGIRAYLAAHVCQDDPAHKARPLPAGNVHGAVQHDVAFTCQAERPACRHDAGEHARELIGRRQRVDVRG
ncbi:hypothetical protein D3C76_848820 [compost metagenome]